jgi:hypothetical protein
MADPKDPRPQASAAVSPFRGNDIPGRPPANTLMINGLLVPSR